MSANDNPQPAAASSTPAERPPQEKPALTDHQAFELVRDGIKHEDELTHQRLTWLLTAEAFFLTAFGVLAGILVTKDHSWMETLTGFLVLILFSGAAIWLCQIVWDSVDAADAQLHVLKNWWYTRLFPNFNQYRQPGAAGGRSGAGNGTQQQNEPPQRNRVFAPWTIYERLSPEGDELNLPDDVQKTLHSFPPIMGWFKWRRGLGVGSIPRVLLALNSVLFVIAFVGAGFWLLVSLGCWTPPAWLETRLRAPDKAPSTVLVAPATNSVALKPHPLVGAGVRVTDFTGFPDGSGPGRARRCEPDSRNARNPVHGGGHQLRGGHQRLVAGIVACQMDSLERAIVPALDRSACSQG